MNYNYGRDNRYGYDRRRRSRLPMVLLIIVVLLLLCVGGWIIYSHYIADEKPEGGIAGFIDSIINKEKPYAHQAEWDEAKLLAEQGEDFAALQLYRQIILAADAATPDAVYNEFDGLLAEFYHQGIPEATQLINEKAFDEANILAKQLAEFFDYDPRVQNLVASSTDIEKWTGTVEHMFFHPLIVYPTRAFPKSGSNGQDQYMVTVFEFNQFLKQMYERDYILIAIESLYTAEFDEKGAVTSVTKNELWLPKGKKPVIISIDDLNYYKYMIEQGQSYKMVLDEFGEICTYSVDTGGKEVYSKDNEVVTILDAFVKTHPDFSFNNAKGVIALTGYEGVLGWRINDNPKVSNYDEELAGAQAVVAKLKSNGWTFASHGQGHRHSAQISYALMVEDTDRWNFIVRSVVGPTSVYIYPYGEGLKTDEAKFKYLQQNGFAIFCTVGQAPYLKYEKDNVQQSRRNIDGIAFAGKHLNELFDIKSILDPVRPWPTINDLP